MVQTGTSGNTYSSAREHHSLEQQQSDLPFATVRAADCLHECPLIEQRHIRVNIGEVGVKEGILQRLFRKGKGTLLPQILEVFCRDAGGGGLDEAGELKVRVAEGRFPSRVT